MKKIILPFVGILVALSAASQCNSSDYSFGSAQFGVSPDPQMGESFEVGYLGQPYTDIIYMLVPTDAGDVDSSFAGFGTIDSLRLDAVFLLINDVPMDISTVGLGFTCNNNGDLSNPCAFLGGEQYCADLTGTPTMAGVFPLQIAVTGWINSFIGTVEVPYVFSDYSLTIVDPDFVVERTKAEVTTLTNIPNPVVRSTDIIFELTKSQQVTLTVHNLLGEAVSTRVVQAKKGKNTVSFDASGLNQGIYLYSVSTGEKKITRRMVVN